MKKAIIIIFSFSLILTVFGFIFFTGYDTKKVGLATVRYKKHVVDETINYLDYDSNYPLPGRFQYIIDDTFVLSVDFDVGNWVDGYTPVGYYTVKGYISYKLDTAISPGGLILFATDPFPVTCNIYYPKALDDDVEFSEINIKLLDYEITFDSFTFFGVINNCTSLYWSNQLQFADVENILDFALYILDFIKSLFVLIGKIFYAVGYFFI